MNETIKSVIIETGETLIICRNMNEVKMMERHLKLNLRHSENYMDSVVMMFKSLGFNWIYSDEYSIKKHLRKSGDCSFSFNDGVCDGFANLNWFRERQSRYCEHKLILGGLPTIIEVDDED